MQDPKHATALLRESEAKSWLVFADLQPLRYQRRSGERAEVEVFRQQRRWSWQRKLAIRPDSFPQAFHWL